MVTAGTGATVGHAIITVPDPNAGDDLVVMVVLLLQLTEVVV